MGVYGSGVYGAGIYGAGTGTISASIAGNPYDIAAGSLSIESAIGRRSTASITVRTASPMYFLEDSQISIYDQNGTVIFAGYLSAPQYRKPGFQKVLYHNLSAVDKHRLADKRRVVGSFSNVPASYIAQWLITNYLAAEGVTAGQIYDGGVLCSDTLYCSNTLYCGDAVGVITTIAFDYCKASEALDQMVKTISSSGTPYFWQINYNSTLDLIPYTANTSTTVIDGSDIDEVRGQPTVTRTNPAYRNVQIIKGGTAQTVQQNETRKGDSNTVSWPMSYALASAPTITVNSVAKTVGIRGVDTGKDFYWSKGEKEISQDSSGTKLTSSDTLAVSYIGQYDNVAIVSNDAQVALEASIDGSSGKVEELENIALDSLSAQLAVAGARLTRYAVQSPATFSYATMTAGFAPGQYLPVNIADLSLDGNMLIESVSAEDSTDGINVWYHLNLIAGPSDTTWSAFWGEITGSGDSMSNANTATTTIVTISKSFSIGYTLTYSFSPTVYACPICSNSTLCGNTTIVC